MATRIRTASDFLQQARDRLAVAHYCESAGDRQVVLVLQGGGALGAYQVGVYEALHEAGIEPAPCATSTAANSASALST